MVSLSKSSTIQRSGNTTNPFAASDRLTIAPLISAPCHAADAGFVLVFSCYTGCFEVSA
jgi:hypothetical protein